MTTRKVVCSLGTKIKNVNYIIVNNLTLQYISIWISVQNGKYCIWMESIYSCIYVKIPIRRNKEEKKTSRWTNRSFLKFRGYIINIFEQFSYNTILDRFASLLYFQHQWKIYVDYGKKSAKTQNDWIFLSSASQISIDV